MLIRSEQMDVFEKAAEEGFVRRLCAHLRERYAEALVRLPDQETIVRELPDETLDLLVRRSIERARKNDLTYESSISAFTALMFEVAPNFDTHQLSKMLLTDEEIEPNARLNELLKVLTEKNWESIRGNYDVNAWQINAENAENTEKTETPENSAGIEKVEKREDEKQFELAETMMNIENPKKNETPEKVEDYDFLNTVVNININEE